MSIVCTDVQKCAQDREQHAAAERMQKQIDDIKIDLRSPNTCGAKAQPSAAGDQDKIAPARPSSAHTEVAEKPVQPHSKHKRQRADKSAGTGNSIPPLSQQARLQGRTADGRLKADTKMPCSTGSAPSQADHPLEMQDSGAANQEVPQLHREGSQQQQREAYASNYSHLMDQLASLGREQLAHQQATGTELLARTAECATVLPDRVASPDRERSAPGGSDMVPLTSVLAEKVQTLQQELQEAREEVSIQVEKYDLEVRHAQHMKKKYENACAEITKLKAALAAVTSLMT